MNHHLNICTTCRDWGHLEKHEDHWPPKSACDHTWDYSNTPGVDICTTCGDLRDWPEGVD